MAQFEEHADGQMFFDELLKAQGGDSKAYEDFVDKFKPKKTTDDCFTPVKVYECVAEWVTEKYGVERSRMVRPFYPNGDYEAYSYPSDAVVVDNPPFSIITQIVRFYARQGVKFFLFGPSLTLISGDKLAKACAIPLGVSIPYANGAEVITGFITNLESCDVCLKSEPELFNRLNSVADEIRKNGKRQLPKYSYPDHVVTAAMVQQYSKYGVPYEVSRKNSKKLRALNAQEEIGKRFSVMGFSYPIKRRQNERRQNERRLLSGNYQSGSLTRSSDYQKTTRRTEHERRKQRLYLLQNRKRTLRANV